MPPPPIVNDLLLDQWKQADSLHWFDSVRNSFENEQSSVGNQVGRRNNLSAFRVSAANLQEISIYFNKYIFGYNKYFLAYFWVENKYMIA